jgi:hypothetical protein
VRAIGNQRDPAAAGDASERERGRHRDPALFPTTPESARGARRSRACVRAPPPTRGTRSEEQAWESDYAERLERNGDEQVARRAGGRDEPVDDPEGTGAGELERAQPVTTVTSPSLHECLDPRSGRGVVDDAVDGHVPSSVPASTLYSPGGHPRIDVPEPVRSVMRDVGQVANTSMSPPFALASSTEPQNASTLMLPSRLETSAGRGSRST